MDIVDLMIRYDEQVMNRLPMERDDEQITNE